jgi:hypothetical protein
MCTMWITHGIIRPPDRSATEYLTCAWLYTIIRTKSPTLASILVVVYHVAFATYTSWDKQTCFSTLNNSIWVSWQGPNQETVVVVLRSKHWQIVATDFKVKLKPRVSRLLHVYDVDHIRHHPTSQSSGHWYPNYVWSSSILRTKSLTLAPILIITRHIAFATYTSGDK